MLHLSDQKTRARLSFLEEEARLRPRRHAARLTGLAALGYLYPLVLLLGTLGVAVALLGAAPFLWDAATDFVALLYGLALLAALLLAVAVVRGFWVRLPEPPWHALGPGEAAPLRAMLDEVGRATGSPPVQRLYVCEDFNAAVAQRRRYGIWGPATNHLVVGAPLLAALTPAQLRAVLAHECGHLVGRHNSFTAWVYRLQQTWEKLAAPLGAGGVLRRVMMGWFVRWFGGHFAVATLAARRLHEYEADRRSAELCGAREAAGALLAIDWFSYRLGRTFWPALLRESARDPLPPANVLGRVGAFFAADPPADALRRWRTREMLSLTPVVHEHPCLSDRLKAMGMLELLEREAPAGMVAPGTPARADPGDNSLSLLGESRERVCRVVNAAWKASVIERWRQEHAGAKRMREELAKPRAAAADKSEAEAEWERIRLEAEYAPPDEALGLLREFVGRFPGHGLANFTLGQLLLGRDDEDAATCLETAMKHDSACVGPGLQLLLDYYREAGRDRDADPVRARLEEHEQQLVEASAERERVGRRDHFRPHDLTPEELRQLRQVLNLYPQVRVAYLAKKQVRLFADKPSYVLAVGRRRRWAEDNRKADKFLAECLRGHVNRPCAVVILERTPRGVRNRLLKACGGPVFEGPG